MLNSLMFRLGLRRATPPTSRESEMQALLDNLNAAVSRQSDVIDGLNSAIALLEKRNALVRDNTTVILGSLLVQSGGKIRIDGNVLDTVSENKRLSVQISAAEGDGSRTAYLVEDDEAEAIQNDFEETFEDEFDEDEIREMENEFLADEDCDDCDDEHDNMCPC